LPFDAIWPRRKVPLQIVGRHFRRVHAVPCPIYVYVGTARADSRRSGVGLAPRPQALPVPAAALVLYIWPRRKSLWQVPLAKYPADLIHSNSPLVHQVHPPPLLALRRCG
jgi:hypothetical protein